MRHVRRHCFSAWRKAPRRWRSPPASGTLRLPFASSNALPKGKWPLLTGTSGGEALSEAAWPVVYAEGPRPLNFEIVRDATGVWLHASNGTTVIVR